MKYRTPREFQGLPGTLAQPHVTTHHSLSPSPGTPSSLSLTHHPVLAISSSSCIQSSVRCFCMLIWLALSLLFLILASLSTWNSTLEWQESASNPPPGALFTVDGVQMHLWCEGPVPSAGEPTFVGEIGWYGSSTDFYKIQQATSAGPLGDGSVNATRFCSYDRMGNGWSGIFPAGQRRGARTIAGQLVKLLVAANVKGKIIMVGMSMGTVRVYQILVSIEPALYLAVRTLQRSPPLAHLRVGL